jgi:hypothetical protein
LAGLSVTPITVYIASTRGRQESYSDVILRVAAGAVVATSDRKGVVAGLDAWG